MCQWLQNIIFQCCYYLKELLRFTHIYLLCYIIYPLYLYLNTSVTFQFNFLYLVHISNFSWGSSCIDLIPMYYDYVITWNCTTKIKRQGMESRSIQHLVVDFSEKLMAITVIILKQVRTGVTVDASWVIKFELLPKWGQTFSPGCQLAQLKVIYSIILHSLFIVPYCILLLLMKINHQSSINCCFV